MSEIKVTEEIKIRILCSVSFSPPGNYAFYEIMSKNLVEPERPQMAIWRRVAFWIYKATRAQVRAPIPTLNACTRERIQISKTYCFSTATVAS